MVKSPFKFHTRLSTEEAQKHTRVLIDTIKTPILQAGVGTEINLSTVFPLNTVSHPYPVIVILNGVGGSGKSSFATMVAKYAEDPIKEISVIDPLRDIASSLIHTHVDDYLDLYKDAPMTSEEHTAAKSDQYRSLLHDLKIAWQNLNDGPNIYCLGKIVRMITIDNKDEIPGIIFVNIREEENIKNFRDYCHDMGLICFSLLIDGTVDAEQFSNEGDALVNTFEYDVTIPNKGNLDDLSITAFIFYKFISRANHMYGIGVEDDDKAFLEPNSSDAETETTQLDIVVNFPVNKEDSSNSAESFLHANIDPISSGTNTDQPQSTSDNRVNSVGGRNGSTVN